MSSSQKIEFTKGVIDTIKESQRLLNQEEVFNSKINKDKKLKVVE